MMDNTINGRTPDEIKRWLEACGSDECHGHHTDCPYRGDLFCIMHICGDARAYIHQLERERDAAVEQLRKGGRACSTCKFSEDIPENDKICEECRLTGTKLLYSNWEWVGPHPTPFNPQRTAWDIYDGTKLRKQNISTLEVARHVIDTMIKYGYWRGTGYVG